jgi:GntR family transcriptional regulator
MEIRISSTNGMPVYRQIVNQVKYLVASGRLQPNQELPTIRGLAERLLINPNTVVHAYAELEKDGVIIRRHGSGTYVAENLSRPHTREVAEALADKIDSVLADAAHSNLGLDEILQLVRERHALLTNAGKTRTTKNRL